jgi:hypothetical protein
LAFKQNGTVLDTFTLSSGSLNSSIPYSFAKLQTVTVTVYFLGNYTNEIGFQLKNGAESICGPTILRNEILCEYLIGLILP